MERELWDEIVVDNFAGGGGASTGIKMAIGRDVDIAINHDPAAIAMHKANHPWAGVGCPEMGGNSAATCDNAVPPQLPAALVRANLPELCGIALQKAM